MRYSWREYNFILSLHKDFQYMDGRMVFQFGMFKLINCPKEGAWPSKRDYKGFYLRLWLFKPVRMMK